MAHEEGGYICRRFVCAEEPDFLEKSLVRGFVCVCGGGGGSHESEGCGCG